MYSSDEEQAIDVAEVVEHPNFAAGLAAVGSWHAGSSCPRQRHKEAVVAGRQIVILTGWRMTSEIAHAVV